SREQRALAALRGRARGRARLAARLRPRRSAQSGRTLDRAPPRARLPPSGAAGRGDRRGDLGARHERREERPALALHARLRRPAAGRGGLDLGLRRREDTPTRAHSRGAARALRARAMRRLLTRLAFVLAGLGLGVLAAEVTLRVLHVGQVMTYQPSDVFGYL